MHTAVSVLISAFNAILFLQSGLDKVSDRKGNLEWLTGHFAKSPLEGHVPDLLSAITALELAAGASSALGVVLLPFGGTFFAFAGAFLSATAILCLFMGQRLAKDYAGAAVLPAYFLVSIMGLLVLLDRR